MMKPKDLAALKAELVKQHGEPSRARIERGVDQVAALWRKQDGSEADFRPSSASTSSPTRRSSTAPSPASRPTSSSSTATCWRSARELRRPSDLDVGPLLKVDPLFAAYDPSAHLVEDLFRNKLGFVVLLNFPLTTLQGEARRRARTTAAASWAEVRLAGRFGRRVPARGAAGDRRRRRPPPSSTSPSTTSGCTTCSTRRASGCSPRGCASSPTGTCATSSRATTPTPRWAWPSSA